MRLVLLSDKFFRMYGNCKEVLQKPKRPYVYLEILIDGVHYAVPFRHHITHKHAFLTGDKCGIDYTKAVVIHDLQFIDSAVPQINQAEYNTIKGKDKLIANGMKKCVGVYKKAREYKDKPQYANIIRCSSLQYFDDYVK